MPASKNYVLNTRTLDGLLAIRDEYGHTMLARAMRIDNSTLRRILQGKSFSMRTGLKVAKSLSWDKVKGIPLHCVFHESKEAIR